MKPEKPTLESHEECRWYVPPEPFEELPSVMKSSKCTAHPPQVFARKGFAGSEWQDNGRFPPCFEACGEWEPVDKVSQRGNEMKNEDWVARIVAGAALVIAVLAGAYAYETYQIVGEIRDILVETAKSDAVQLGKEVLDGLFGSE